jgi:hypothetical protein
MTTNPELIKNIQLELNPVKMVLMPTVLGMIFFIAYLNADEQTAMHSVQITALVLFELIVFVWGTKMAVESLVSEFNDRTWDSQRMTAIGPWTLAWGKLFGSTLFAWYGGLCCLLVFAASAYSAPKDVPGLITLLLVMLFTGLLTQTAILAFILTEFAKNRDAVKLNISSYSLAAVLLIGIFMSFAGDTYTDSGRETVQWHGILLHPLDMMLYSSFFFCLWGGVGLYRAMRKELQFASRPWAWAAFVVSVMVYCAGFISSDMDVHGAALVLLRLYVALFVGVLSFYFMVLAEPKNAVDLKLLLAKLRQREWSGLTAKAPAWLLSLLLVAVLCALLLAMKGLADLGGMQHNRDAETILRIVPLSLLMFCLRDLGIVLHVNFSSVKKNRDMTAAFYLVILYLLIPLLLKIAKADAMLPWFVPFSETSLVNGVLPAAVQAGLALHFVWRRIAEHPAVRTAA